MTTELTYVHMILYDSRSSFALWGLSYPVLAKRVSLNALSIALHNIYFLVNKRTTGAQHKLLLTEVKIGCPHTHSLYGVRTVFSQYASLCCTNACMDNVFCMLFVVIEHFCCGPLIKKRKQYAYITFYYIHFLN